MQTPELQSVIVNKKDHLKTILCKSKSNLLQKIKKGQVFTSWKTTGEFKKRGSSLYFECACTCGILQFVLGYDLIREKSTQCRSCATKKTNLKHGQNCHDQISYEYHVWQNQKSKNRLDVEWDKSFQKFFKDIGKRSVEGHTLLRKNNKFLHSISNSYWGHPRLKFFKDLEGLFFSEWKVLEKDFLGKYVSWLCECSCGKKDYIKQTNLLNGTSTKCKSCAAPKWKKHGHSKKSVYRIYHDIKSRCYRVSNKNFMHYGGRGIRMCQRWLDSVEDFIIDMGERPSDNHSIDRIDVNGNYCPENCTWATQKDQCKNRRKLIDLQNRILELEQQLRQHSNL